LSSTTIDCTCRDLKSAATLCSAEFLLEELEQHYYSSAHKGPLPSQEAEAQAGKLAELCAQALQMTGS
jgi:hypothetical protein